jgi:hypothetical protein
VSAGPALALEAHVLRLAPHAGDFTQLSLFCADEGLVHALLRAPAHSARASPISALSPDLFDRLALTLDRGRASGTGPYFVRELRLVNRHTALGRDYATLAQASRLARVVVENPVPEESRAAVDRLLSIALAALARPGARPDVIYLKSIYVLARDEGHPLKQQWLPTLPADDARLMATLIPLPADAAHPPPGDVTRLIKRLEAYLCTHADFKFS